MMKKEVSPITPIESRGLRMSANRHSAALSVEPAISARAIDERVSELARQISQDYRDADDSPLIVIGVLKGAWVFVADLVRKLSIPLRCEFVRISSYGDSTRSSRNPRLLLDVTEPVSDRDILIVDDILDTGISLEWLIQHFAARHPRSLRTCVLLDKPARREVNVHPDYVGFDIPDRFVVGYGIDCAEQFRELPYIGFVNPDAD